MARSELGHGYDLQSSEVFIREAKLIRTCHGSLHFLMRTLAGLPISIPCLLIKDLFCSSIFATLLKVLPVCSRTLHWSPPSQVSCLLAIYGLPAKTYQPTPHPTGLLLTHRFRVSLDKFLAGSRRTSLLLDRGAWKRREFMATASWFPQRRLPSKSRLGKQPCELAGCRKLSLRFQSRFAHGPPVVLHVDFA